MATISPAAGSSGLAHSEVEGYLRRRRVLLVDDDTSIRVLCSLNLRAAECEAEALRREESTRAVPIVFLSAARPESPSGCAPARSVSQASSRSRSTRPRSSRSSPA